MILKNVLNRPFDILIPVLFLFLLFYGQACSTIQRGGTAGPPPSAETLAGYLEQENQRINTFAGRGNLRYKDPESDNSGDVVIAAAQPDQLLIQAFDFLGRPALAISSNKTDLRVVDYHEARYMRGPATTENFSRFMPLGLALPDVITFLSGGVPVGGYDKASVSTKSESGSDYWVLTLTSPGFVQRVWFTPPGKRVKYVEMGRTANELVLRLEYSGYREISGRQVPFHLQMTEKRNKANMTVDYEEVKVNQNIPAGTFTIQPPEGVKEEPIPG